MPGARGAVGAPGARGPPGDAGRGGEAGLVGARVSILPMTLVYIYTVLTITEKYRLRLRVFAERACSAFI